MLRLLSLLGIIFFIFIALMLSRQKSQISKRIIISSLLLQFFLALTLLGIPSLNVPGIFAFLFEGASRFFNAILAFSDMGAGFVLGHLTQPEKIGGFIFAAKALPVIVFFSALMSVGYHLGIMQKIVGAIAWIMQRSLRITGVEALAAAANIFIGQTEAPLMVKPYIRNMSRSQLMCLMTGGMATIAGSVLAAFVGMLNDAIPNIAGHLLTASVLSAPAAIMYAKILIPAPEEEQAEKISDLMIEQEKASNLIEAAANGASDGLKMALNVGAMLIAFIAIVAMANSGLNIMGEWIGFSNWASPLVPEALYVDGKALLSLEVIFSWFFTPFAFLMGIPWEEAILAASLLGKKVVINEFVAYMDLTTMKELLSQRSMIIMSYALCGFANFASIGIQIGGIGELAPNKRGELAKLGILSVVGGSLAAFTTACIASLLI